LTNLSILETVRRHYLEEYKGILTTDLALVDGLAPLPPGPGLGVDLDPDILMRPGVIVDRTSKAHT